MLPRVVKHEELALAVGAHLIAHADRAVFACAEGRAGTSARVYTYTQDGSACAACLRVRSAAGGT